MLQPTASSLPRWQCSLKAHVCAYIGSVHLIVSHVGSVSAFGPRARPTVTFVRRREGGGIYRHNNYRDWWWRGVTCHRRHTSSRTAEQILGTESSSITLLLRCKWPGWARCYNNSARRPIAAAAATTAIAPARYQLNCRGIINPSTVENSTGDLDVNCRVAALLWL